MAEAEEISSDEFKMLLLGSGEHPDYQSWEGFENPFIPANDGKTALDLLKENQANQDESIARQTIIDYLELMDETPNERPSRTASRL